MANEYTPDLITLIGDDGKEIEFEILDIIENDEGKFYVLYPFFENPEDAVNDSGEYYIFEVTEIDGEEELAEIEMMTNSTELPLFLKSVTMKNFMMKMTNSSFFCI